MLKEKIERILPLVQKPARYTGGELNSVVKDKENVEKNQMISLFSFNLCISPIAFFSLVTVIFSSLGSSSLMISTFSSFSSIGSVS